MLGQATVASVSAAASLLFDVVVFAGGEAKGLSPLCDNEPRPMLAICNRPMIWYCLCPWISAGCRTFFVCVNENCVALKSYLLQAFPGVNFIFVLLQLTQGGSTSTTCDAVKAYLDHKESLKPDKLGQPRDALLLSCDTLLPGVDFVPFIHNFYCSMSSVSVLLFCPLSSDCSSAKVPSNKAKNTTGQRGNGFWKSYKYRFNYVAYEEKDANEGVEALGSKSQKGKDATGDVANVESYRLHFMNSYDDDSTPNVSFGFAARRPNLTLTADTMDAHVYLVRDWVLRAIAEHAGQGMSVRRDIIPLLARSQHTVVNEQAGVFLFPDGKINFHIPKHWLFQKDSCVELFNVSRAPSLPREADNLVVSCTIYKESPDGVMRVYRVKSRDDFIAVNYEILARKCELLSLGDVMACSSSNNDGKSNNNNNINKNAGSNNKKNRDNVQVQGQAKQSQGGCPRKAMRGGRQTTLNYAPALSRLLPDFPWSFEAASHSKHVKIVCSFLRSDPVGSALIIRSIIGSHVIIGDGVNVTNSIILDHAEIGANAVIENSIVGLSAVVNPEVRVSNCTIGPRCLMESTGDDVVIRS